MFATIGKASEEEDQFAGIDESKMEQALDSLMKDSENINEDDPKQAADLMRKMTNMTGLELGPGMEEALRRMENGEDPEQIEAEMGDQRIQFLANGDGQGDHQQGCKKVWHIDAAAGLFRRGQHRVRIRERLRWSLVALEYRVRTPSTSSSIGDATCSSIRLPRTDDPLAAVAHGRVAWQSRVAGHGRAGRITAAHCRSRRAGRQRRSPLDHRQRGQA